MSDGLILFLVGLGGCFAGWPIALLIVHYIDKHKGRKQ